MFGPAQLLHSHSAYTRLESLICRGDEKKGGTMEEQEKNVKEVKEALKIEGRFKSGANWFFWIAGLSVVA